MSLPTRRRAAILLGALFASAWSAAPASDGAAGGVLVAFGDSITAGTSAAEARGRPARYPELLAARLRARPGAMAAVRNAGIPGNRLLADGAGPKGVDRFRQDVLAQPGVTHVLILIGINDIGFSMPEGAPGPIRGQPSAAEITAGLQQLVRQAQERGIRVLLGTLPPFKGASYWNKEKEGRRADVNRWIRARRDVQVVDFDAALRSAADPQLLEPRYDSGDHLHPGPAGYAAMADAIDIRRLQR